MISTGAYHLYGTRAPSIAVFPIFFLFLLGQSGPYDDFRQLLITFPGPNNSVCTLVGAS